MIKQKVEGGKIFLKKCTHIQCVLCVCVCIKAWMCHGVCWSLARWRQQRTPSARALTNVTTASLYRSYRNKQLGI